MLPKMHDRSFLAARRPLATALAAAAVVLISSWSCISPTAPSNGEADILVTSHWESPVDVFMDGGFRFSLAYKETAEIDNVSIDNHLMEAKNPTTGEVVAQSTVEVKSRSDYTWTIEHRARINVDNGFKESVRIFMDGVFQFELAEDENRWILDVSLGNHLLAAFRAADGTQLSSTTIKATENKDYSWVTSLLAGGSPVVIAGR